MPAAVDHAVELPVLAAGDDDRCPADGVSDYIPRGGELFQGAQVVPGAIENSTDLEVVDPGIIVGMQGQAAKLIEQALYLGDVQTQC